jgi:hypothetical protein
LRWAIPNFEAGWEEVKDQQELFPSKETWIKICKKGRVVRVSDRIRQKLVGGLGWRYLNKEEMRSISVAFQNQYVDMPIVSQIGDDFKIVLGDKILNYAGTQFYQLNIWLIEPTIIPMRSYENHS